MNAVTNIERVPTGLAEAPHSAADSMVDGITCFDFEHHVFKMPGARFLLKGHARVPAFRIQMGDLDAFIDISVLRKEFCIEPDSHDGKLIDLAVAGLRYVPDIKPQDSIPSELLSGKASWTIGEKHKRLAQQRLQIQLLSWVSGKEVLITDPSEMEAFLGQIENREKLRNAFRDAAAALGFGPQNPEMVVKQLELLAREVCYIEALRDRYALVPRILEKLNDLTKNSGSDRNAKLELARVITLMKTGIREFVALFTETDAQTGEIISALKSIDRQVKYIRDKRDALHFLLMEWEPHIENLPLWRPGRTHDTDRALSELYRFLAPRFSTGKSLLRRKTEPKPAKPEQPKSAAQERKPEASSVPSPPHTR